VVVPAGLNFASVICVAGTGNFVSVAILLHAITGSIGFLAARLGIAPKLAKDTPITRLPSTVIGRGRIDLCFIAFLPIMFILSNDKISRRA
jgi:hypothetical protein